MSLGKRLDALEQIAEQVQRREMRDLAASWPEMRALTPAELEEAIDEALRFADRMAGWRREGLSEREITRRTAEELGLRPDQVEAECRAILER